MDAGRCGEEQDSGRQLGVEKKAQGLELEYSQNNKTIHMSQNKCVPQEQTMAINVNRHERTIALGDER
jgi:lipopolysaccharide export system protein LptA